MLNATTLRNARAETATRLHELGLPPDGTLPEGRDPSMRRLADRMIWSAALATWQSQTAPPRAAGRPGTIETTRARERANETVRLAAAAWRVAGLTPHQGLRAVDAAVQAARAVTAHRICVIADRAANGGRLCPELDALGGLYQLAHDPTEL